MNVTSTQRSITEYALTLSEQDAQGALTDPFSFGERIAEQLRAAGVVPAPEASNGHKARKPNGMQKLRDEHSKNKKAGRPNGHGPKRTAAGNSLDVLACPQCGQKVTRKYMHLHQRTKHPGSHGTVTHASPEAVPAAE